MEHAEPDEGNQAIYIHELQGRGSRRCLLVCREARRTDCYPHQSGWMSAIFMRLPMT
jgi:hypothetical protein